MAKSPDYQALLLDIQPRPIRSKQALARAYKLIDQLMSKSNRSAAESDMLELLSMLVEEYESREHPTPGVSPQDMLAHLIESRGINNATVARDTEIPRSTFSDILAGRRGISKANVTRLADYFDVPPSVFLEGVENE